MCSRYFSSSYTSDFPCLNVFIFLFCSNKLSPLCCQTVFCACTFVHLLPVLGKWWQRTNNLISANWVRELMDSNLQVVSCTCQKKVSAFFWQVQETTCQTTCQKVFCPFFSTFVQSTISQKIEHIKLQQITTPS